MPRNPRVHQSGRAALTFLEPSPKPDDDNDHSFGVMVGPIDIQANTETLRCFGVFDWYMLDLPPTQ